MQRQVNYCIETWGSWEPRGNKTLLKRLQAISNKYFRLTYNLDRNESVRHILKSHSILNVQQNYDFHVCRLMHKAVNNTLPSFATGILTTLNDFFFFKTPRLRQTEKSIIFAGPKLWNNLPSDLVAEPNFNIFKKYLKLYLLNRDVN